MRLKKIKAEYGDKVNIQYRVFLLRPVPDPSAVFNDYRRTHWGNAKAQPESGEFRLWESGEKFPDCSMPSAEAGLAARAQEAEAWERFHMNLLTAFFSENRNITDPAVLCEVAEKSDLDVARFRDNLESGVYRRQALEEYHEACSLGITGIPSVVVNDKVVLMGAVPRDHYKVVINSILETGDLPGRAPGDLPVL